MESLRYCHDRILPQELARPIHARPVRARPTGGDGSEAIVLPEKLWVNGSRLAVRFMGGTQQQRAIAQQQAAWWTEAGANLHFDFNDAPDAVIRIAFDASDGAWSYIGTDCSTIPRDQPTMNLGFLDGGTAAHEFGHAIGLAHEHQNPRGGIEWNEAAVIRDLKGPPNFWTEAQIRHNVLNRYSLDQIRGTEFDGESIMLYFFPDSWVKSGKGTKANEILSATDKAFISGAEAYPRTAPPQPEGVELKVGGDPVQAEIGKQGEEDLYRFTASREGRHVVETRGPTDVVVKLFGPGSRTLLVAEDDDGGVGLNARIVADLIAGQYFVQVRHYNTAKGTGKYAISVSG